MSALVKLTDEEFLNLPDEPGKRELLNGELIALPPADHDHSRLSYALFYLLGDAVGRKRVAHEEGYRLKQGWLTPDVSVTWPDQRVERWLTGAPMVAIEIASRGNTADEIEGKIATCLDEGAAEVWIIYPKRGIMRVVRKDGELRIMDVYRCELLGVEIRLAELLS